MEFLRVLIRGWTSSFRYPIFISGYQPSLPVPPLSTIYGLLSAVCGELITPKDTQIGFIFQSSGKAIDLESIYELTSSPPLGFKTNVVRREILYEPVLYLYISNKKMEEFFKCPRHSILLGRTSDLVFIEKIDRVTLEEKNNVRCGGSIFPFPTDGIAGIIQALPTHFNDTIPRKALGTRAFCLVETDFSEKNKFLRPQRISIPLMYDSEYDWGFYLY